MDRVHKIITWPNSFSSKSRINKTNGGVLARYSQTLGSLLRTPWLVKRAREMNLTKSQIDKVGNQQNILPSITLWRFMLNVVEKCHYAECRFADCRGAIRPTVDKFKIKGSML
jgi:hypothetical protein